MKLSFLIFLAIVLLSPARAQESVPIGLEIGSGGLSVNVNGSLDFGTRILTGVEQEYTAVSAPQVEVVDARGTGAGWTLNLESSDFQSGNNLLNASHLSYSATGGFISVIHGQAVGGAGPFESGNSSTLATPLQAVASGSGSGMGTYRWLPQAESFRLQIPGTARAGAYQATLTFSVTSGP